MLNNGLDINNTQNEGDLMNTRNSRRFEDHPTKRSFHQMNALSMSDHLDEGNDGIQLGDNTVILPQQQGNQNGPRPNSGVKNSRDQVRNNSQL